MEEMDLTKEAIQKCLEWMQGAEGFVISQAPDLCKEILAYGTMVGWIQLICSLLLLISGIFIFSIGLSNIKNNRNVEPWIALSIVSVLPIFFGFLTAFLSISPLVKVYTAPKLYVIERLMQLLQ